MKSLKKYRFNEISSQNIKVDDYASGSIRLETFLNS